MNVGKTLWLIGAVALIMLGGLAGRYTCYWSQLADGVHARVHLYHAQLHFPVRWHFAPLVHDQHLTYHGRPQNSHWR